MGAQVKITGEVLGSGAALLQLRFIVYFKLNSNGWTYTWNISQQSFQSI
jgi:hypothetical protein